MAHFCVAIHKVCASEHFREWFLFCIHFILFGFGFYFDLVSLSILPDFGDILMVGAMRSH